MTHLTLLLLAACGDGTDSKGESPLPDDPPVLTFLSPLEGDTLVEQEPVVLRVQVLDDGTDPDQMDYAWSLDGAPLAGTQSVSGLEASLVVTGTLPAGTHNLGVSATDLGANTTEAQVTVVVAANQAPVLSFITPADLTEVWEGEAIDVDLLVEDDGAGVTLDWAGPDTADTDGHARFTLEDLPPGEGTLSVTGTDPLGATGTASVSYTVRAIDADGDGHTTTEAGGDDCDDTSAEVSPSASESCNGVDDDCDGETDEGVMPAWYGDADGDTYGDAAYTIEACEQPAGFADNADDCDDGEAAAFPGNAEICDGLDNDCDDTVDEGVLGTWYTDADGDGWGAAAVEACTQPVGSSATVGDCDDTTATVSPSVVESCDGLDNNCDGEVDEDLLVVAWVDADGDGYGELGGTYDLVCPGGVGWAENNDDCSDTDADTHPGAAEACDGEDDDCDGEIDDGVLLTFYADGDADGYGDEDVVSEACAQPDGYVTVIGDCDDVDPAISPAAAESCDGIDQDCDGAVDDDAIDQSTWYEDGDDDGYGDASSTTRSCDAPHGFVADSADCDDTRSDRSPAATEACDAVDNDCDGETDEASAIDAGSWFADADADGHGDPTLETIACDAPEGYVATADDCDDLEADAWPGNDELCDGVDNDCDGEVDGAAALDAGTWYADGDVDGYGDSATALVACEAPAGSVDVGGDCDDGVAAAHPGASEVCDTIDNDCDGGVDEGVSGGTWYLDWDGDGYGDETVWTTDCAAPEGYVADRSDCDDGAADIHPGAAEHCDTIDNDCDGEVADDDSVDAQTWYADTDGDGYGDPENTTTACSLPAGYLDDASDCADSDADAFPGSHATEVPKDGIDTDCDGVDACDDLNCDGWPDIVFPNYGEGYGAVADSYVYFGSASGYSVSSRQSLAANAASQGWAGDLDGDGYQDLILAGAEGPTSYTTDTYIYWGSAAGHSAADRTSLSGTGVETLCVDDFDSDGFKDIFLLGFYDGGGYDVDSYIYWGSAAGWSAADRTTMATDGAHDCDVFDQNGDGYMELLVTSYISSRGGTSQSSYLWWGSATGYRTTSRTTLTTYWAADALVEDLDEDGWADLVFPSYTDGDYLTTSHIWWGSSAGYSSSDRTGLTTYGTFDVAAGDFDDDGYKDLAYASLYDNDYIVPTNYVYYNSASGFSSSLRDAITSHGATHVLTEDLDHDGWLDLILNSSRDSSSDVDTQSYIYWGSSSGFSTSDTTELPTVGPADMKLADLDGDGWKEIIFSNAQGAAYDPLVDSYIYWGSASGYSAADRTDLPTNGAFGTAVVVGAD